MLSFLQKHSRTVITVVFLILYSATVSYATGGIPLSSNFNLNSALPLDARTVVANSTARDAIAGYQRYEGLTVYQVDTQTNYQLQGGVTNSDWVDIGASSGGGGGGSSYTFSTGLTNTSGTVTNNLLTGISGGQTIIGSTDTSSGLTFKATTGAGSTGADIIFQTGNNGGTEAMRILNNGNVGIGTINPNYTLSLSVTGATIGIADSEAYDAVGGTLTVTAGASSGGSAAGGDLILKGGNSNTGESDVAGDVKIYGGINNFASPIYGGAIRLYTSDAERFTVLKDGNVGIGISNPSSALDVAGTIKGTALNILGTSTFNSVAYTFPSAQAAASGYLLTNNGSGTLSWVSAGVTVNTGNNSVYTGTLGAASALNSNFLGYNAGSGATTAIGSSFLGYTAGSGATGAQYSNFLGYQAGNGATSAIGSSFVGTNAGFQASSAQFSSFFGYTAGSGATGAQYSNFIGYRAGKGATAAEYSNLLGFQAGYSVTGNNIGGNNIVIGTNISLPNATTNSLNIGGILFGTGAYSTTTGNPSITAVTSGKIGVATNTLTYTLNTGNSSVSGIVAGFTNSTGTCTINPTSTALSCSSDMHLKRDIARLSDGSVWSEQTAASSATASSVLSQVLLLQPVRYHWNSESSSDQLHAGFIAQDVQRIFPDLVSTDDATGYLTLSYSGFVPYLTQALQEINVQVQGITTAQAALQAQVQPFFTQVIASVVDGVGHLKSVIIDTLSIGSSEKPSGITLYDTVTKQPYCLQIANGQTVSVLGACGTTSSTPAATIITTGTGDSAINTTDATSVITTSQQSTTDVTSGVAGSTSVTESASTASAAQVTSAVTPPVSSATDTPTEALPIATDVTVVAPAPDNTQ